MSDKNEPIFENEEFILLLKKYEKMRNGKNSQFFDVEEFEQIIDYYLDEFQYDEASEAARLGAEQHPASVEIKYKIVHIFLEQGNGKKSLEMLENIPNWEHANSEYYYLKGTALCISGHIQEAEKCFDTGLEISSDDVFEALLNIAIAFENARQYRQAVKYLEIAHQRNPDFSSVLYDLGYFYERLNNFEKSVDYYQKYLDLDPFSENVWYNLGVVYSKLNMITKAIDAYDYSIALNPDYASAYFNKANAFGTQGKFEEALASVSDFLEIEPENVQALCFLGECYESLDRHAEGLETYRRIINLDNADPEGWFGAGMVFYQMGKYKEAASYILKALEFDSKNTDYLINLGFVYEEDLLLDDAEKCYRAVCSIDYSDLEAWNTLAALLFKKENPLEVYNTLIEAMNLCVPDACMYSKLAVSSFDLKDPASGLIFLERAMESDPGQAYADFENYYSKDTWTQDMIQIIEKYNN